MRKFLCYILTTTLLISSIPMSHKVLAAPVEKQQSTGTEENVDLEDVVIDETDDYEEVEIVQPQEEKDSKKEQSSDQSLQEENSTDDSDELSAEEVLEAFDYGEEDPNYCNPDEVVASKPMGYISLVLTGQAEDGQESVQGLPKGTEDDPWQIGAASKDNVIAYMSEDDDTLIIDGTGNMKTYYKTGDTMVRTREWEKKRFSKVLVKDTVTAIGGYCLANFPYLKEVIFEGEKTKINAGAFQGSASLESVKLPGRLTTINGSTFYACTELKAIDLPDTLTSIQISAFRESGLAEVSLSKIKTLGKWAFRGTPLTEVTLPGSLRTVDHAVFSECTQLKTVHVEEGMNTIFFEMFANCQRLEKIYLPHSLEEIEESAFYKKKKDKNAKTTTKDDFGEMYTPLKEVHYDGDPDEWEAIVKGDSNEELVNAVHYYKVRIKDEAMFAKYMEKNAAGDDLATVELCLENDLDLKDYKVDDSTPSLKLGGRFAGVLDGQGHTIRNLSISLKEKINNIGLFESLRGNAVVKNLYFENAVVLNNSSKGKGCGILAGSAGDHITLENVRVASGKVEGYKSVGGLIGHMGATDDDNLIIENCANSASVRAENDGAGGIVGLQYATAKMKMNTNYGDVTAGTGDAGGIVGYVRFGPVTFEQCKNQGKITADTGCAAGICGSTNDNERDELFIFQDCMNSGEITGGSGDSGGIVGFIKSDNADMVFHSNENSGDVISGGNVGGIIGYTRGGSGEFVDNTNRAVITSTGAQKDAGGLIGGIDDDSFRVEGCSNTGKVSAVRRAGGIVAYAGDDKLDRQHAFFNCENTGEITSEKHDAAGIVASLASDNVKHRVENNKNHGVITGYESVGGIIGFMEGGSTNLKDNVNDNDITSTAGNAGGIIGTIEDDPVSFTRNSNEGKISGFLHTGDICGYDGYKKTSINNNAASMFSSGNIWILLSGIVVLAGAVLVLRRKKAQQD